MSLRTGGSAAYCGFINLERGITAVDTWNHSGETMGSDPVKKK